nr:caffeic acid 3-O-methyltransferase-like [Ipomoea batatas]
MQGMNLRNDGHGIPRAFLRMMEEDPVCYATDYELSAEEEARLHVLREKRSLTHCPPQLSTDPTLIPKSLLFFVELIPKSLRTQKAQMEEMVKIPSEEEVGFLRAMGLQSGIAVVMVSKAAIELGVFEIIAKGGEGAKLSAQQIADCLPCTQNPNAPLMLDRMLKFLANHSILSCTLTQDHQSSYSLTPISNNFVPNQDGVSLSSMIQLITHKAFVNSWYQLFSHLPYVV